MRKLIVAIMLLWMFAAIFALIFSGAKENSVSGDRYIIDRFEGEFAVVEYDDTTLFDIPMAMIPAEAKEGDVITIKVELDKAETAERTEKISEQMNRLFN